MEIKTRNQDQHKDDPSRFRNVKTQNQDELEDDDASRFRKVHPDANESQGRSIPMILHDRSLRGRSGIGGRRKTSRYGSHFAPGLANSPGPAHPSPSSVIAHVNNDADEVEALDDMLIEGTRVNMDIPMRAHESSEKVALSKLKMNAYPVSHANEIKNYAEQYSVTKFNWGYLRLNPKDCLLGDLDTPRRLQHPPDNSTASALSTISIDFAPDGRTMASTHGDHMVKITCCHTGALIRNLEGHPRTPWTVKYHPIKPNIVASGCLGYQVRIWDWNHEKSSTRRRSMSFQQTDSNNQYNYHERDVVLLYMIRLQCAIISLSFHPSGSILAVASGTTLHLWNYDNKKSIEKNDDHHEHEHGNTRGMGPVTQLRYDHNLRCVHFPPGGDTIIVGGSNTSITNEKDYSLRMWDFDLEAALNPRYPGPEGQRGPFRPMREAMSNSRIFLQKALLYNDGGIDVSSDGKMLCGCADLWLPHGIDNAMEIVENMAANEERLREREIANHHKAQKNHDDDSESFDGDPNTLREAVLSVDEEENNEDGKNNNAKDANESQSFNSPPRERIPATGDDTAKTPPNPIPPVPKSPPVLQKDKTKNQIRTKRAMILKGSTNHSSSAPPPPPLPPSQYQHAREMPQGGRYVSHVVIVSLDDASGTLGRIIEATPLGSRAASVTCVKFSPSAEFCLLGYGVRENAPQPLGGQNYHPASAIYRVRGGMTHVATMLSEDDDVNIARFHPEHGHGFVYGTKQGRVRVLNPWPCNYYYD